MAKKTLVYKYKIKFVYWAPPSDPKKIQETTVTVLQKSEEKAEDKFWSTPPGSTLLRAPGNTMIYDIEYLGSFFE